MVYEYETNIDNSHCVVTVDYDQQQHVEGDIELHGLKNAEIIINSVKVEFTTRGLKQLASDIKAALIQEQNDCFIGYFGD